MLAAVALELTQAEVRVRLVQEATVAAERAV
jgi:hypothetical protein